MNSKEALERLRELIGEESYALVLGELAGATVYFPENHAWQDKEARNALLRADFYSGNYEIGDLAKKYDLSISRVYKIVQNKV
jgi:Mor family transcriptional regulator